MDAATLLRIVPTAPDTVGDLLPGYDWFCSIAQVNTVARCDVAIAMVAEESASFHALEEYASGAEYNGRLDLGNTEPGDGERFKGRTLIQITGRNNYGRVSRIAYKWGLVPTPTYFLDHPEELADPKYAWLGPAIYWLGDHNHGYGSINAAADAGDLVAATLMVNGGMNGYDTRRLYYGRARAVGEKILPDTVQTGAPTMMAYRVHDTYYVLQDGALPQQVHKDYAQNISTMVGRPITKIAPAMHKRIIINQHKAIRSAAA